VQYSTGQAGFFYTETTQPFAERNIEVMREWEWQSHTLLCVLSHRICGIKAAALNAGFTKLIKWNRTTKVFFSSSKKEQQKSMDSRLCKDEKVC
jgi:hypothetical protein